MLNEKGYDAKGLSAPNKAMTYFMINIQTLRDQSPSHISEMMIQGSTMGVIDATKKLREYTNAEPKIRNLMEGLKSMEENNIDQLQKFL